MIDTHCHIDDPQYSTNEAGEFDASVLDAFIASQRQGGVETILVPGVDESSCRTVLDICSRYPDYLLPALGLHPEEVRADYREVLDRIHGQIMSYLSASAPESSIPMSKSHPPFVAIGEIGLDYHFSTEFKTEQQDAFRIQLEWARALDLPIMLHARDATEDTLRIINDFRTESMSNPAVSGRWHTGECLGVAHCFSGSYETALAYIRAGFYLGIGGVLTFKNCKLAEALCPAYFASSPSEREDLLLRRPSIPLECLLLETDAPYMAPVPYRGKRNESRWMSYVVDKLSNIYGVSPEEMTAITTRNARTLFPL